MARLTIATGWPPLSSCGVKARPVTIGIRAVAKNASVAVDITAHGFSSGRPLAYPSITVAYALRAEDRQAIDRGD